MAFHSPNGLLVFLHACGKIFIFYLYGEQSWTLVETSEVVASAPLFYSYREAPFLEMPSVVLFCAILHGFMNF